VAALRKAFLDTASDERMQQLADKLLQQALAGDVAAAKLFLAYVLGKPSGQIDPDRVDLDEFELLASRPSEPEVLRAIVYDMEPVHACALVQQLQWNMTVKRAKEEIRESHLVDGSEERKAKRSRRRGR
jgi:hypothetical protein